MPTTPGVLPSPSRATASLLDQIIRRMRSAVRAQIIGHMRPDGDCLGSMLGVHHILNHFKVEHTISAGEFTIGGYSVIAGHELVEPTPRKDYEPDLTIFVDCASLARAYKEGKPVGSTINIDHHGGNTMFADLNWVDANCAAVGEMLFILAREANVPLNPDFANALLLAILTDTGSFRFSNVRPQHFEMAAELMRAGASPTLVSRAAYENRSRESVAMIGKIFSSLTFECDGHLAWGEIRGEDLKQLGGPGQLPENLASDLLTVRGVEVALLFLEIGGGKMRVNLRSKGPVDVSKLAAEFGGGGHPPAAGITIEDTNYEQSRQAIIVRACEMKNLMAASENSKR